MYRVSVSTMPSRSSWEAWALGKYASRAVPWRSCLGQGTVPWRHKTSWNESFVVPKWADKLIFLVLKRKSIWEFVSRFWSRVCIIWSIWPLGGWTTLIQNIMRVIRLLDLVAHFDPWQNFLTSRRTLSFPRTTSPHRSSDSCRPN